MTSRSDDTPSTFSDGIRLFSLMLLLGLTLAPTFDELNADTVKSFLIALGAFTGLWIAARQHGVFPRPAELISTAGASANWVLVGAVLMLTHALLSAAAGSFIPAAKDAARWVVFLAIFVLAQRGSQSDDVGRTLVRLSMASLFISSFGLVQFYLGVSIFPQGAEPASSFVNRNFAAEVVACLMWSHLYVARQCASAQGAAWNGAQFGVALVYIIACATRSAMLAAGVIGMLYFGWTFLRSDLKLRKATRFAVVGAAAVVVLMSFFTSKSPSLEGDRFFTLATSKWQSAGLTGQEDGSISVRKEILIATLKAYSSAPILGLGAGALGEHMIDFQANKGGYEIEDFAHNEYLQWAAEYGLIGVLFSVTLIAFSLVMTARWMKSTDRPETGGHLLLMLGSLLIVMLLGFPTHLAGGLALLALTTGFLSQAPAPKAPRVPRKSEKLFIAILVAGSLVVGSIAAATEWSLNTSRKISIEVQSYISGMTEDMKQYRDEASAAALEALRWAAWNHRALAPAADELASIGELETARKLYSQYLEVRPKSAGGWANMAKIAQAQENESETKRHLATSLEAQFLNMPALTLIANRDAAKGNMEAARSGFLYLLGQDRKMPPDYDKGYRITEEFFHSSCAAFAQETKDAELLDLCRQHRIRHSENGYLTLLEMAQEKWSSNAPDASDLFIKGIKAAPRAYRKRLARSVPAPIAKEVLGGLS